MEVVSTAHNGPALAPKRSSLPSRLPTFCSIGRRVKACVGACSNQTAPVILASRKTSITAKTTAAWRMRPMMRPNIHTQAIGMRMIETSRENVRPECRVLERMRAVRTEEAAAVRAELFDGHEGRHRPARDDLFDAFQSGRVRRAASVIGIPPSTNSDATTRAMGSSTRNVARCRSRKKLPISLRPAKPRASAANAAMPVAAETNCSHIRAQSCER